MDESSQDPEILDLAEFIPAALSVLCGES